MTEENGYINFAKPFGNVTVPSYCNLMPSEELYFTYKGIDSYNAEFNIYKQIRHCISSVFFLFIEYIVINYENETTFIKAAYLDKVELEIGEIWNESHKN